MKKITISVLILALLFVIRAIPVQQPVAEVQAASPSGSETAWIAPEIQTAIQSLQTEEKVSVIVTLRDQANLSQIGGPDRAVRLKGIIQALQAQAQASQKRLIALLQARQAQGKVDNITSFWVMNGLEVTATQDVIQEVAAQPEVLKITPDAISVVPASPQAVGSPEQNLAVINASAVWNLGWTGQGIVVASMDSGVDFNHPDLVNRWRGGNNSWFDPYGQHPTTPTDLSGHGTGTMGVMVGGDTGGTSIGVAPQAKWIAVKIFNDQGSSTATAIHQGFQWLLNPDGDINTADAPHVVNNSWTFGNPGCNLEFQFDLQALRAAGILPVFAAGNFGSGGSTSASPANYPESFAVGATNNSDSIYSSSSRGPSACGEGSTIYPELTAPGVNIKSSDRYGLYTTASGTSLAAPHVAGTLALLLSAYPNLTTSQQEAALLNTAVDLGSSGPDNKYGYGRLNALAAYQWLAGGGSQPTPTPVPPTPTPVPAAPPQAPTNLTVNTVGRDSIKISWQDNASNEQGFYIQQSINGGSNWVQLNPVAANVTTYTDQGLSRKTTYWYRVQAYNADGASNFSNVVSAQTK